MTSTHHDVIDTPSPAGYAPSYLHEDSTVPRPRTGRRKWLKGTTVGVACGSVDAFLQHLDLVAGIRTAGPGA